jgi:hypothetical protein
LTAPQTREEEAAVALLQHVYHMDWLPDGATGDKGALLRVRMWLLAFKYGMPEVAAKLLTPECSVDMLEKLAGASAFPADQQRMADLQNGARLMGMLQVRGLC